MTENRISAEILADSISPFGHRITTYKLILPRFLLAELNTHRDFSRSSASSRAIPFKKMVKMVQEQPFIPIWWQKDHKGMQGSEYFEGGDEQHHIGLWLEARDKAIMYASKMANDEIWPDRNLTKQLCNRLLEPFMYHTVLLTATEFGNFFSLRASEFAERHFQDLAEKMLVAYNESEPKYLAVGEWHLPFGDLLNYNDIEPYLLKEYGDLFGPEEEKLMKVKIASARCARVSYNSLDGNVTFGYEKDFELYERLKSSGHWSAMEHCAVVMSDSQYVAYGRAYPSNELSEAQHEMIDKGQAHFVNDFENGTTAFVERGWCGNFRGFIQHRKQFLTENRTDNRIQPIINL